MLILLEPKTLRDLIAVNNDIIDSNWVIYNINSNTTDFHRIYLMPNMGMINVSSPEFDNMYISTILSSDYYFCNFMEISIPLYRGRDVFLLIYDEDTVFNPITEVLVKLIQQRYGYRYIMASSYTDVLDAINQGQTLFTTPGIINFDSDFNRYQELLVKYNPKVFINERIDDSHFG